MKVRSVTTHSRLRAFHVRVGSVTYPFPFARCEPPPSTTDPVVELFVDPEIGGHGFTYQLASGGLGTVLGEQVLEHNDDPALLRDRALYFLTLDAEKQLAACGRSKRDIIRQLRTSASQFYRLMDPTNYRKSIDQMLGLLQVLGCKVEIVVRAKSA